jgi:hypothetical protein
MVTPANVKRKQVMERMGINSPSDLLSPCSQKLWKRTPAEMAGTRLDLMAGNDDDPQDQGQGQGEVQQQLGSEQEEAQPMDQEDEALYKENSQ